MKNVEKILEMFTDGTQLAEQVKELLRCRDAAFRPVEDACMNAAEKMGGLETLLALRDRQLDCDLRFAVWQGMKLNLENFRSPLGSVALTLDYTQLLQEHIMFNLPEHRGTQKELDRLLETMTDQQREAIMPVDEFYAYLETVGLKVAHYLGFRLGDLVYPMAEPGYVADAAATRYFRVELERYIGFSVE